VFPQETSASSDASSCEADVMSSRGIAAVAKLIANPTCAEVLDALLSDRELNVSALASEIRIPRSTVSEAVGALAAAGLVRRRKEGRITLVRLAGDEVADALEVLGRLAKPPEPIGLRAVTRMEALRRARTCYDHFAGELGVTLADRLLAAGVLATCPDGSWCLLEDGRLRLIELGIDPALLGPGGRRPLVRRCPDWTENRPHVAGRLGAAICTTWIELGMVQRLPASRAVRATGDVEAWLAQL
jgi:DNA-binding transcriptional ArsR family regulator